MAGSITKVTVTKRKTTQHARTDHDRADEEGDLLVFHSPVKKRKPQDRRRRQPDNLPSSIEEKTTTDLTTTATISTSVERLKKQDQRHPTVWTGIWPAIDVYICEISYSVHFSLLPIHPSPHLASITNQPVQPTRQNNIHPPIPAQWLSTTTTASATSSSPSTNSTAAASSIPPPSGLYTTG
jgi:hypothetical protein